jgi:hypothetical protein
MRSAGVHVFAAAVVHITTKLSLLPSPQGSVDEGVSTNGGDSHSMTKRTRQAPPCNALLHQPWAESARFALNAYDLPVGVRLKLLRQAAWPWEHLKITREALRFLLYKSLKSGGLDRSTATRFKAGVDGQPSTPALPSLG